MRFFCDCNWSRTHNHLVHKRTLNHLANWTVWLNGWVFFYELNGCWFENSCSYLNFRFRACFEQGVLWHSGNYRVWTHPETRTWHDKNIQYDFLEFYQVFLSRQVKRCAIITYKHGIYELSHQLPNNLRLNDLSKLRNVRKVSKLHKMIASAQWPCQNDNSVNTCKKLLKYYILNFFCSALFHMKTTVSLKYFVNYCSFNNTNMILCFIHQND